MRNICPLCNGLYDIKYKCKICNSPMEDKGGLKLIIWILIVHIY